MMALISMFGPLAAKIGLSILDAILQKNASDVASRQAFLDLTQKMAAGGLISVSLHDSYKGQQDANQAAVDQILKEREAAKSQSAPPAAKS